jgi:uncharacterized protein YfaS (alpha-2-macroglobulin family)
MYGIIPIEVKDPNTVLNPKLRMPKILRPGKEVKLKVHEANDKPMTYTIALVDEGLLDLTRFKTPDPHANFYKREGLGVKTWDLFDLVAGNYGGSLDRFLSVGGDAALSTIETQGNRFPPMVRYLGPFYLEKKKTNSHNIAVPQYVGSVRAMVVAGHEGAYGYYEKAVPVRNPLMVLAVMPRVLGPEEEVEIPISVFAMEPKIKNVTVSLSTEKVIRIDGSATKTLGFNEVGDKLVRFKAKVGTFQGWTKISINAEGHGEKARQDIEIEIRNPNQRVVDVLSKTLQAGEQWDGDFDLPGAPGTNDILLESSVIPPLNLAKRLSYLIQYPHGCVEQVTSMAFPQLFLNRLLELSSEHKRQSRENVQAAIHRIRNFQGSRGGFLYWPGNGQLDDWATSYVGHFLIEAQKAGYTVYPGMISQWKKYQKNTALSWSEGGYRSAFFQAYRLYTLALAGSPELGAMNRLRETAGLPVTALCRLASAYYLAGQREAAKELVLGADFSIRPYREMSYTYGNALRDSAMFLETLSEMALHGKAKPIFNHIAERLGSKKWLSTQTTAYCLWSIMKYVGLDSDSQKQGKIKYQYSIGGQKAVKVESGMPVTQSKIPWDDSNETTIQFKNLSGRVLYTRLIREGLPSVGKEKTAENGLQVRVDYVDSEGKKINPEKITQGTDFIALVKIKNTSDNLNYEQLAISHIVPSGWEIQNERMAPGGNYNTTLFDYQDIRDDRIYTYFNLNHKKEKVIRILLNASYLGKYYLPPIHAEAMYDGTINGRMEGRWISVVQAGK